MHACTHELYLRLVDMVRNQNSNIVGVTLTFGAKSNSKGSMEPLLLFCDEPLHDLGWSSKFQGVTE